MITEDVLEQHEAALEALRPSTPSYRRCFDWKAPDGNLRRVEYVQEALGYFPGQELLTLLTRVLKDVAAGEYGVNVGELFARRNELKSAIPSDFDEEKINESIQTYLPIVQGLLHLVEIVPGLQEDVIAISLGVPRDRATRAWFKEMIAQPPLLGGLTMDEGVEIMRAAIEQNGGLLRRFLAEQLQDLAGALMEAIGMGREDVVEGTATGTSTPSDGGRPQSTSAPDTGVSV